MERTHRIIAISMGDMNGIGPEVILKALEPKNIKMVDTASGGMSHAHSNAGFLIVGSETVFTWHSKQLGLEPFWGRSGILLPESSAADITALKMPLPGEVMLVSTDSSTRPSLPMPGTCTARAGSLAMESVAGALQLCISGQADALVTAPISKEAIYKAGYTDPGHTEFLARLTQTRSFGMMLVNDRMRVGLATIHHALSEVAGLLSAKLLEERIRIYHKSLVRDFGISEPEIAVLGLNPHAGDGGVLGLEEQTIIAPVVEIMRAGGMQITGPWPADGFFGSGGWKRCDLVLAMYHDQGLIPVKLTGFGETVNITAGLPIIRTSPDHGTGFSIAGKNRADSGSMQSAVRLALRLADNRRSVAQ